MQPKIVVKFPNGLVKIMSKYDRVLKIKYKI